MIFRFGPYELDEEGGELRREGVPVAVQPKPLALLQLLVRERERVVPADELLEALWPDVAVTSGSLTRAVSLARRAIGDDHRGELIRSVARRGYRFCGDVVALDRRGPGEAAAPAEEGDAGDPFVGRAHALARLDEAWREVVAGRGAVALVSGPPGIGKTRLVERFARGLERAGALVLTARCREGEGVPPFWAWAQLLRQLLEHRGDLGSDLRERAARSTELAGLLPELDAEPAVAPAELSQEQRRFLFFDAVARALVRAGRRRPLVLVLEDLQWAGAPALRLLEHVAFEAADAPVLVAATVRDEPHAREEPLERALATLRAQPRCVEIALRGFSRREVAELLERRLGRPPPPDLSSELVARTEGNPLFVREAVRLLAERGDLRHPERIRSWAVSLPERALDLIRRPLERLSPPCAELVAAAAVVGREFPLALAAAVGGVSREQALDLLDEAEAAGVVAAAPEAAATWRFAHALFREVAYASLPAGRRARLHHRAAEELERRHGDDLERVIAEVAHHRRASLAVGEPERAWSCAVRAAERAARLAAHEQAVVHWEQAAAALEHAEAADPERRLATLLALGEALGRAGERDRRREAFASAMRAARELGRPVDFARAAIGFCDLSEWAPRDDEALALLEEARAGLPEDATVERVRVVTRLAYLSARERPDAALPLAREAVELARRFGEAGALQDAIYALFFLLAGPDHLEERRALADEVVDLVRAAGARDPSLITVLDAACDCVAVGDSAGARRQRALAAELAGSDPHPGRVWHLRVFDAGMALLRGRFADAEALAQEAIRLGLRIGHPYARGVDRALRAILARERGDEAEVLRIFEPGLPIRIGPRHWVQAFGARALVAEGRRDEARALFEDLVVAGFERIPRNIRWQDTMVEIALLCADLGDAARAEALSALLEPVEYQHGVLPMPICYGGPITRCLARLAELRGRLGDADELYAEALASVVRLDARPMQARILAEHGAMLVRRGDRRRARGQLDAALRLATELGMRGVEARAQALLERASA